MQCNSLFEFNYGNLNNITVKTETFTTQNRIRKGFQEMSWAVIQSKDRKSSEPTLTQRVSSDGF